MTLTEKQVLRLKLENHNRISPYLTKCCLRASANVSYQNAERDVQVYTGIKVSVKTQQRLVHRYTFPEEVCAEKLEEISVDGGKVRLRVNQLGESAIFIQPP